MISTLRDVKAFDQQVAAQGFDKDIEVKATPCGSCFTEKVARFETNKDRGAERIKFVAIGDQTKLFCKGCAWKMISKKYPGTTEAEFEHNLVRFTPAWAQQLDLYIYRPTAALAAASPNGRKNGHQSQ